MALAVGCNFGQKGITPPADRIFLPTGVVPDPDEDFLYVVNSNSDLRYNAGTVVAVDLGKAAAVRAQAATSPPATCAKTRFSRAEPVAYDYCCLDLLDSNILNCNEPQFVRSNATVELGSFGSALRLQRFERDGIVVRRLFVAVRAEPSITFIDVTVAGGVVAMRCTGPRKEGPFQPTNAYCEDNWRVLRPSEATPGSLVLPEEPHVLSLDESLGALYVGHLTVTANQQVQGGGVSIIDICAPASESSVRFAGLTRTTFLPAALSQTVGALSPGDPLHPATRVYATARNSTAISGLALRDPNQPACDVVAAAASDRDLTLVPAETFYAPAFLPNGADIRGILFSPDGLSAYVLHRHDLDSSSIANPGALVAIDRRALANGTAANAPMDVLPVCNGPTGMQMHDAGRGPRIYVTCYDDGQIYVIDPLAFAVTGIIDVGAGPTSLVFSPRDAGKAYVASFANSHLSVIDLAPGSPTENRVVQRIGLPHGYGE